VVTRSTRYAFPSILAAPFNIAINAFIYGSLLLWSLHVLQTKAFKSSPLMRRASRTVISVTSVCLVIILFQQAARQFQLTVPAWLEPLAGRGKWEGLQGYWIIGAVWGLAGMLVLYKTAPSSVPIEQRDPYVPPLPEGRELEGVFLSKGLSERESEVASRIVGGAGNKEIAEALAISYNTVKNHVASIFRKLGATNRFELIRQLREKA
jgi:DNA-binding CsgD family transcriptional regulator